MIAALKATVAHFSGDDSWLNVRPPLVELGDAQREELLKMLESLTFAMPGLARI
jgi:4-hydroxy-tetrahydrodipicolinate synthase